VDAARVAVVGAIRRVSPIVLAAFFWAVFCALFKPVFILAFRIKDWFNVIPLH
jgi:hypothetical protein